MVDIRNDLIQKELEEGSAAGLKFQKLKLSNRFIYWLFNNYYVLEYTEHYYDSEPHFEGEEFNMYMDYRYPEDLKSGFRYSKEEHTREELECAYNNIVKQKREYEPRRVEFCNWIEVHCEGNWGASQKQVDEISRCCIEEVGESPTSYDGRLFIAKKEDEIHIYYYGRDFAMVDYWWIFKKRPVEN